MEDLTVADHPNTDLSDLDGLPIPPLDPTFFSQHLDGDHHNTNQFFSFNENDDLDFDFTFDDLDFDFTLEDLFLPSDDFLIPASINLPCSDPIHIDPKFESGSFYNPVSEPVNKGSEILEYEVSGASSSKGSGNCCSNASDHMNYSSHDSGNYTRYINSSPNCANNLINGVVDQEIQLGNKKCLLLKRKHENEDFNVEIRSKYRRLNNVECVINEEEEKRKSRLMRNRESAQLSRQRKKHYAEELEDKVRAMHSTIQGLNAKIYYVMAENASLRQQLGGNGMCPPTQMSPLGVGRYPQSPMVYPWVPYIMKPQGSHVPLLPIPRLKSQKPLLASEVEKKKSKGKAKKVASVSFLGLLFFILLFGGLVPVVNVKYGGMRQPFIGGGSDYIGNRVYQKYHPGRMLTVKGHLNGTEHNIELGFTDEKFGIYRGGGHVGGANSYVEQNSSGSLLASLYVPRNDKLLKIDGNLIIHSVMPSEKAMAPHDGSRERSGSETDLAVSGGLAPSIPILGVGRSNSIHPYLYRSPTVQQRALASADMDNWKSTATDCKLQQWFQEGLAGPMLSSGTCTEVFQFDASPASAPGGMVPSDPTASVKNVSAEHSPNSTHLNNGRNRRILHGLPIPLSGSYHNMTEEHMYKNQAQENFHGNNSLSSMVVSVLVDPREAGDIEGDGMMGPKSLSQIFVVVFVDSVKYVTYSCMLPLRGSGPHLVTT